MFAVGVCLTAPPCLAQSSLSGAESFVDAARDLVSGGGRGTSTSFAGEVAAGDTVWAHEASSESFTALGGALWAEGALGSGPPVVFQTVPPTADKDGGDPAEVLGFNFAAPGAGATSVQLAGSAASGVSVLTNTRIAATTPAGLDVFGNPLGDVPVQVDNSLGTGSTAEAFTYLPALRENAPTCVGGTADLSLFTSAPTSFGFLIFGLPIPLVAVEVPPLEGKLVLIQDFLLMSDFDVATNGVVDYVFPIPDDAGLAGVTVPLQSVSIEAILPDVIGSFTNVIEVVIQP